MLAFLKRMIGQDPDAEETQRQFNSSLRRLEHRSEELKGTSAAITAIIQDVERKNAEIALSQTVSGRSGEHRVTLPSTREREEVLDGQ